MKRWLADLFFETFGPYWYVPVGLGVGVVIAAVLMGAQP